MQNLEEWNPGLANHHHILQEVLSSLPGYNPKEIHALVRLFENPDSPIALKGAISLPRHDAVHVLLGRGLLAQDEAFVIGFTMGTSKNISSFEVWLYETISLYLYPREYRMSKGQLAVYELGLHYGKSCNVSEIYHFPFEEHQQKTVGELREMVGINIEHLKEVYQQEKSLLPNTLESNRLPI